MRDIRARLRDREKTARFLKRRSALAKGKLIIEILELNPDRIRFSSNYNIEVIDSNDDSHYGTDFEVNNDYFEVVYKGHTYKFYYSTIIEQLQMGWTIEIE